MPIMMWDESLDIGVAAMNAEHRQILDAMNRLYDAWTAGVTGDEINRLVARLGAICTSHFKDEEAYMASIGFAGLKTHRLIHAQRLETYANHAAAIVVLDGQANARFFDFLRYWLTAHICGIDRKYGEQAMAA